MCNIQFLLVCFSKKKNLHRSWGGKSPSSVKSVVNLIRRRAKVRCWWGNIHRKCNGIRLFELNRQLSIKLTTDKEEEEGAGGGGGGGEGGGVGNQSLIYAEFNRANKWCAVSNPAIGLFFLSYVIYLDLSFSFYHDSRRFPGWNTSCCWLSNNFVPIVCLLVCHRVCLFLALAYSFPNPASSPLPFHPPPPLPRLHSPPPKHPFFLRTRLENRKQWETSIER